MTFRRMKVLSKSSRKHDTAIILSEHLSFPSHFKFFLSGFYVKEGALEILDSNVIEMPKTFLHSVKESLILCLTDHFCC